MKKLILLALALLLIPTNSLADDTLKENQEEIVIESKDDKEDKSLNIADKISTKNVENSGYKEMISRIIKEKNNPKTGISSIASLFIAIISSTLMLRRLKNVGI
ncbi:hypothetical protein HV819_04430 [Anaerococcus sp. AGMB00486]|uniref:LPXTG cell wall anchor domain-containing protein n=1 Tax=Anaerococcus faecalis TaxID=2742993 RepID=A0ABX2N967_9FIRM|nr:hypothetical protein [Anaerococcus faecalis]NVF11240.1 hypothetical protein [Anaerococcus faecalis]